ncbi:DUF2235 domain-containing protein, partial [Vibrio cholerae]
YYRIDDSNSVFSELNSKVLFLAKQGQYSTLQNRFSASELKENLMALNLFHHSSGDDIGMSPLWDKNAGCYKRASYSCEQGK